MFHSSRYVPSPRPRRTPPPAPLPGATGRGPEDDRFPFLTLNPLVTLANITKVMVEAGYSAHSVVAVLMTLIVAALMWGVVTLIRDTARSRSGAPEPRRKEDHINY